MRAVALSLTACVGLGACSPVFHRDVIDRACGEPAFGHRTVGFATGFALKLNDVDLDRYEELAQERAMCLVQAAQDETRGVEASDFPANAWRGMRAAAFAREMREAIELRIAISQIKASRRQASN